MSVDLEKRILQLVGEPGYQPVKPKALARKLTIAQDDYPIFRDTLKRLVRTSRLQIDRGQTVSLRRQAPKHLEGIYKAVRQGGGFVRPKGGITANQGEVHIRAGNAADAAPGDTVAVEILRPGRPGLRQAEGRVTRVVERATQRFVGTYQVRDEEAFVRIDGGLFPEPIYVGDPGAKQAIVGDKVVVEMLRFPSPLRFGQAVVTEVLGHRGQPGVDLLSVIRQYGLPDTFSEQALAEAREIVRQFDVDTVPAGRRDLTGETIVTIDPDDAHDFDDAISLKRDERGYWALGVHIADVAAFVRPGSVLDAEARERGTSVYLPGRVLPMLPELISNGLASLQEGQLRFTKSVFVDFDPEGRIVHTAFDNTCIRVTKRFTYAEVMKLLTDPDRSTVAVDASLVTQLEEMRRLAAILRARRYERGYLALSMPQPELDYDEQGAISGAHYAPEDESHQMIEEFMVTANEAVAEKLADEDIDFLRRVHPIPDAKKLSLFGQFARSLGFVLKQEQSRTELQQLLAQVADRPEKYAVNYALLRSMREAVYSPERDGHFALASRCYCHFTSPIRRYPDLTVHRLLDDLVRMGKASSDPEQLDGLGQHCSQMERRAEKAERELTRVKLLDYLRTRIGLVLDMVITGVENFGFFAQGVSFPAEGLVHVSRLGGDFFVFDSTTHTLEGQRTGQVYRLGDAVRCRVQSIDLEYRLVELGLEHVTDERHPTATSRLERGVIRWVDRPSSTPGKASPRERPGLGGRRGTNKSKAKRKRRR